jgi:large subunit ribosomal protein L13
LYRGNILLIFVLTGFRIFFRDIGFFRIGIGARVVKKYTYSAKNSDNKGKWLIVDASGAVLGRLASNIASHLRGKHNPMYTPHADTGDSVIVINAEKIVLTGRKLDQKNYYRHSGYTGGLKTITAKKLIEKKPEDVIRFAVKGMLPKNSLGRKLYKKLHVYAGDSHPHSAQQPTTMSI